MKLTSCGYTWVSQHLTLIYLEKNSYHSSWPLDLSTFSWDVIYISSVSYPEFSSSSFNLKQVSKCARCFWVKGETQGRVVKWVAQAKIETCKQVWLFAGSKTVEEHRRLPDPYSFSLFCNLKICQIAFIYFSIKKRINRFQIQPPPNIHTVQRCDGRVVNMC